jgi:hypothetical protein
VPFCSRTATQLVVSCFRLPTSSITTTTDFMLPLPPLLLLLLPTL